MAERKYFGTDGIRGRSNAFPITADCVLRIGMAVGEHFRTDDANHHRVVIGKDTRRSSYMVENALTAGLTAVGMNVHLLGPIPTPAVGLLTRSMRADLGIMISASHNPFEDNGMKFFGPNGYKISKDEEERIEERIDASIDPVVPSEIGRARRIDGGIGRYVEFAKTTFPKSLRLSGLRVVVDCANGAAYRVAPDVLWELGGDVVPIAVSPDGANINYRCGATDTRRACQKVIETRADVGICLDGDADRVVLIDERGRAVDGDQALGLLAKRMKSEGRLAHNTLVASIMSNFALERHLSEQGISIQRTDVGDKHVIAEMLRGGYSLGGEQSGHVIMAKHSTTGDGLITALQLLAILVEEGRPASEIVDVFEPLPQILQNVRVGSFAAVSNCNALKRTIESHRAKLNGRGRIVVRNSGTELVVRIMVEGTDASEIRHIVDDIDASIVSASRIANSVE
ncbi:MAG: phosphoglucosamine mutase [Rhodobacteraceae bacterium]|nr:phosphoglucosamine mutase [Paracoccaceae bacterium]